MVIVVLRVTTLSNGEVIACHPSSWDIVSQMYWPSQQQSKNVFITSPIIYEIGIGTVFLTLNIFCAADHVNYKYW